MSAWSEFCKKYALENGISYTEASKLPVVKDLYKLQKIEVITENDMIFQEKLEAAIVAFEAETLEVMKGLSEAKEEEILEPLIMVELPEDEIVTVSYEMTQPPLLKSKIFISKKRVKTTSKKLT